MNTKLNRQQLVHVIEIAEEAKKVVDNKYIKSFSKLERDILKYKGINKWRVESFTHIFAPLMYFESDRPELDYMTRLLVASGCKFIGIVPEPWNYIKEFNEGAITEFNNYIFELDGEIIKPESPSIIQIIDWMEAHGQDPYAISK